jgi:hypothetical protein
MIVLNSSDDFKWYKKNLDVVHKCEHLHIGEPTEYPCKVTSVLTDDWGLTLHKGPNEYEHHFIYRRKITCPSCGNSHLSWDQPSEEA